MIRIAIAALALLSAPAAAQERISHCIAIADAAPGIEYLHRASWRDPLPEHTVRLRYIAHSMFLIQSPGGTDIVTDYNGWIGTDAAVPDVATMNHAHSSHWTMAPDPRIPHVLEGWGDGDAPSTHRLEVADVFVRNVPTDIRGRMGGLERYGNSIFVFEVAGLCIGHLGHLHHEPDEAQYAALGRLDVVMAAVDGGLTVDLPTMTRILTRLKSSVVIPMHWFAGASLTRFLRDISRDFAVEIRDGADMEVSLRTLPDVPTVVVLRPAYLADE